MTTDLRAWFNTRPTAAPSVPPPPRGPEVIAAATSRDGTADVRVVRRSDGHFTFLVVAWTNFSDAGGNPHYTWHAFRSPIGLITDSYDTAVAGALLDAKSRGIDIDALVLQPHERTARSGEVATSV